MAESCCKYENLIKTEFELPTQFDLIVVGTGVVESIVAAAASRIGKRVLHIDSNNYYGGVWASLNLDTLNKIEQTKEAEASLRLCDQSYSSEYVKKGEKTHRLNNKKFELIVFSQEWHVPEKAEDEEEEAFNSQEKLLQHSRKFNLDLAPKLHYARGDFVELLISSNIARYTEFRSVSRVLAWVNGQLEVVPCSRSDVFSSTKVSAVEKRILMKLMTSCLEGEMEFTKYKDKTFLSYLQDCKLTDNLIHYVLTAISNSSETTPFLEGFENTKRFLTSLGRYGKTPFLYSMYGSGEITQAFCRLSAVFGGVYALSQDIHEIVVDDQDTFKGVVCGKQRIDADNLVIGAEYVPESFIGADQRLDISRAIFITDRSIMEDEREHLSVLRIPPEKDKHLNWCTIIETGALTGTNPKGLYVVHMFSKKQFNSKADLNHCVEKLFSEDGVSRPKVLWSFFFSVAETTGLKIHHDLYKNVFECPGPDLDLDYDQSIKEAKKIFDRMYPNTEFLPRAPDPEEIVIEGEDTKIGGISQGVGDMHIDTCDEALSDVGADFGDTE